LHIFSKTAMGVALALGTPWMSTKAAKQVRTPASTSRFLAAATLCGSASKGSASKPGGTAAAGFARVLSFAMVSPFS
jgi:hypothetical protein